jgi:hypothetical protein
MSQIHNNEKSKHDPKHHLNKDPNPQPEKSDPDSKTRIHNTEIKIEKTNVFNTARD